MKEKRGSRKKKARRAATAASSRRPIDHREGREPASSDTMHETFEAPTSAIADLDDVLGRTLTNATRSAADFNLQLLEIGRSNANSAFDFACRLIGTQSPADLIELSVAQARKQFESFTAQAQQLATFAQREHADPAASLSPGAAGAFGRARSHKRG